MNVNKITLSNASVYPHPATFAFDLATQLGFDGLEIMILQDSESQSTRSLAALIEKYQLPIRSLHVPCLLFSRLVWNSHPLNRLITTVEMADQLAAPTVVVHPPLAWQKKYLAAFSHTIQKLQHKYPHIKICVENMFPWRLDWIWQNPQRSAAALRKSGSIGKALPMYAPSFNPAEQDYAYLTLDTSHCMTSGTDVLTLAQNMGVRLTHVHLSDGTGSSQDEHLPLGTGIADLPQFFHYLHEIYYPGDYVLEISTHRQSDPHIIGELLQTSLDFTRKCLSERHIIS